LAAGKKRSLRTPPLDLSGKSGSLENAIVVIPILITFPINNPKVMIDGKRLSKWSLTPNSSYIAINEI